MVQELTLGLAGIDFGQPISVSPEMVVDLTAVVASLAGGQGDISSQSVETETVRVGALIFRPRDGLTTKERQTATLCPLWRRHRVTYLDRVKVIG